MSRNDRHAVTRDPRQRLVRITLAGCLALTAWAAAAWVHSARAQEKPPEEPDVPSGFVTIANGDFQLDGRQFRHIGVNTSGLMYEYDNDVLADLNGMQGSGIRQVRVFLPNSQLTKEQVGDRLQWILDQAWARGIRVTLPMTDYYGGHIWAGGLGGVPRHRVKGDDGYYTVCIDGCGTADPTMVLNPAWFSSGYTQNYLPFVRYIVTRFKNHPAVFAWEVGNELRSDPYSTVKTFYTSVVSAIKTIDPYHLVAPGIISTNWLGIADNNDPERDAFYRDTRLDYVIIHSGNGVNSHHELLDVQAARRLGKPLVIEETGMNSLCPPPPPRPYFPVDFFDRMKQYYY